jgi:hypothetical protein
MEIEMTIDEAKRLILSVRHDLASFDQATDMAAELSQATGAKFIPTDAGEWVYPRYDVIELPKVGSKVSYAFNGDYYPCGEISAISASLKIITTTTGKKFYRRRLSGAWVNDGTWSLIPGHVNRRNPEF